MKLRTGEPWMTAEAYGRTLKGLTLNLLVRDVEAALRFEREVLGVDVVYQDPDFAVVRGHGGEWMLHADHTYLGHPSFPEIPSTGRRGLGLEIRLHGLDPDAAQAAAERLRYRVLSPAVDKGHGLREVFLVDPDGYTWVADAPVRSAESAAPS